MSDEKNPVGIIFNIQKFSTDDGPGIRTTVFFKGCPLRCRWCANPESQLPSMQILWDMDKCIHCYNCSDNCPVKAISWQENKFNINTEKCVGCGKCVIECPNRALRLEGQMMTVDEVIQICLQDYEFYEESNGGVTLSGGEVLNQPEFAIALIEGLHAKNIHITIETSGYADNDIFKNVINDVDLILFDLKHWDADKHFEGTGVSNKVPLANMKNAIKLGKNVLPRIPVIPNYNDKIEDAIGFVRKLKEVGANKVQLLPFHQYGQKKYNMLNIKYEYDNVPALHETDLEFFQKQFIENNIDAFF